MSGAGRIGVGDAGGLLFGGVSRPAHLQRRRRGPRRTFLLHGMDEFVSKQATTFSGLRREPLGSEHDVSPDRIRRGSDRARGSRRVFARVDPHSAQVVTEAALEVGASGRIKRLPG